MASHLSSLPNELLSLIAEHLEDDAAALRELAVSSKHLQKVAEAVLYRRIFFRTGAQCNKLLQSIQNRPERATSVDFLDIRCKQSLDPAGEEDAFRARFYTEAGVSRAPGAAHELALGLQSDTAGLLKITSVLDALKNLKSLVIESPVCNYGKWVKGAIWDDLMRALIMSLESSARYAQCVDFTPSLGCQRQLTLHWNGAKSRYWTMNDGFARLFAHPTLEELTLSCATFGDDSLSVTQGMRRTPMKRLTLIECNLSPLGFLHIMSRPKALEYLYLGENRDHQYQQRPRGEYNELCAKHPAKFLAALEQQQHSLSELCYRGARDDFNLISLRIPSNSVGLSAFGKLTTIRMDGITKSFESLITAETTRPPNLEAIHVDCFSFDLDEQVTDVDASPEIDPVGMPSGLLRSFCLKAAGVKTLKSMNIGMMIDLYAGSTSVKHKAFESVSRMFDLKKVTFKIFTIVPQKLGLIPPYLYGEDEPLRRLVYDATDGIWLQSGDHMTGNLLDVDVLEHFDFDAFMADGEMDIDIHNDPFLSLLTQGEDNDTF